MIKRLYIFIVAIIILSGHAVTAAGLSASAAVEKTEVYLGEPFAFQIQEKF